MAIFFIGQKAGDETVSIFRIQKDKENPYVMVNKTFIDDVRLSWKAKGILLYLLSKPDDWKVYEAEIQKHSKDKIDGVKSGIKELIKSGYVVRTQKREKGQFKGYDYDVYEYPKKQPQTRKKSNITPLVDFPSTVNPSLVSNDTTNKRYGKSKRPTLTSADMDVLMQIGAIK